MWLRRTALLNEIHTTLMGDCRKYGFTNHYYRGPRGSGKTDLLHALGEEFLVKASLSEEPAPCVLYLLAKDLHDMGRDGLDDLFALVSSNTGKGVVTVLLLDETHCVSANESLWSLLLRDTLYRWDGLVVVAAGVSSFVSVSANFLNDHMPTDIMMKQSESESLAEIWWPFAASHNARITLEGLITICRWVIGYTGGHAYQTMTMLQHVLQQNTDAVFNAPYHLHLWDEVFYDTEAYTNIRRRCFNDSDLNILKQCILKLEMNEDDIQKLVKLGYWNPNTNTLYSSFLYQVISRHHAVQYELVDHDAELPPIKNILQAMVVLGLRKMNTIDFRVPSELLSSTTVKNENSLSARWAEAVNKSFPRAIPTSQAPTDTGCGVGQDPSIDYVFDGILQCAVEISKNNNDLAGKLHKLGPSGIYRRWQDRGVVLNFTLTEAHERTVMNQVNIAAGHFVRVAENPVYSHKDMYHFVKSSNCLYHGTELLVGNVVTDLGGCTTLTAEEERVSAANVSEALSIAKLFRRRYS